MKMTAIEKYFVNSPGHTGSVARHAIRLMDRIEIQPGWRYLDVGCGVGGAPRKIAETYSLDVTGVDIDPEQIEAAGRGGSLPNLRFKVADATQLSFAGGEFDIVAASKVTHHIPEWKHAIGEMARVTRSGGYLVYSDFIVPKWLISVGRRLLPAMGFPSEKAIMAVAALAGLELVHRSRGFAQVEIIWKKK
jgi:ubiquinone/menaquinone biosynthesis C-methylase UbiE